MVPIGKENQAEVPNPPVVALALTAGGRPKKKKKAKTTSPPLPRR